MPFVLISGCGSGIGKAAITTFRNAGWTVYAGSRTPEKIGESKGVIPVRLDPNDNTSIEACFHKIDERSPLDCVVNNAGWGAAGPFEETTPGGTEDILRTNVLGLMEICRQAARRMRQRGRGTIVNISSVAGCIGWPLFSAYTASKWAVEGFSEALWHELRPFGVHVKIVEPAGVRTNFFKQAHAHRSMPENYRALERGLGRFERLPFSSPQQIADVILRAATDRSHRLRYPVGHTARIGLFLRKIVPTEWFIRLGHRLFFGREA